MFESVSYASTEGVFLIKSADFVDALGVPESLISALCFMTGQIGDGRTALNDKLGY